MVEVVAQQYTDALCGECCSREIAVVGLIICFKAYITAFVQYPLYVEVSDEAVIGNRVVAVAEITVDEQSVIEQSSAEHTFDLHTVPSLLACCKVAREVPVVIVGYLREHII